MYICSDIRPGIINIFIWKDVGKDKQYFVMADDGQMFANHQYISLVIPPENRILIAIGLFCLAVVIAYVLVKVFLYTAEQESHL